MANFEYTMTYTVSAGDTILAAHYNTANNEHINNNIPEQIDDYSASVAEMQVTKDPYAGSTEVQALTLAEELQILRYTIWELKQVINPSLATTEWMKDVGAIRAVSLLIEPGATPGTNIDVTNFNQAARGFNGPTISPATNLAKSGSVGSFSLDAGGQQLTMDITEDIIGILGGVVQISDLNSAEPHFLSNKIASSNLDIALYERNTVAAADMTSILAASDSIYILVLFVTSS